MGLWLLTLNLLIRQSLELGSFRALLFCLVFDCGMGCMSLSLLVYVWVLFKLQSIVIFNKIDSPLFLPVLRLLLLHLSFSHDLFCFYVFIHVVYGTSCLPRGSLSQKSVCVSFRNGVRHLRSAAQSQSVHDLSFHPLS